MRLTAVVFLGSLLSCALLGSATASAAPLPRAPVLPVTADALVAPVTGQQLAGDHPNAEHAIASTTKLMTALITLEHVHNLSTMFRQNDYVAAPGDSQIGLVPGERMSVRDLLIALLLPSADDAAEDLAYNVGHGSVARFVGMMNAKARELGLRQTHYTTPSGLDTPGNYSSANDLIRLAEYDLNHFPFFRATVRRASATLYTGRYVRHVTNTDDLLDRVPWIIGVKTGHTDDAGYVLVSAGHRDGMTLFGAVLGTPSEAARDASALALLDYGFDNFRLREPVRRGQLVARAGVRWSSRRVPVRADGSFVRVEPRLDRVSVRVRVPAQLTGPIPRGAIVGQATVLVAGRAAMRIPLVVGSVVPGASPLRQAARFIIRPTTLVVLVLAGLACGAVLRLRRRGQRTAVGRHPEER